MAPPAILLHIRALTIMESPFAGDVERNVRYAKLCIRDCLQRGEAPIASHLLFTQPGILDDQNPDERALGIMAGLSWYRVAERAAFYTDFGWSSGMKAALEMAEQLGTRIDHRHMGRAFLDAMGVVDTLPSVPEENQDRAQYGSGG